MKQTKQSNKQKNVSNSLVNDLFLSGIEDFLKMNMFSCVYGVIEVWWGQ